MIDYGKKIWKKYVNDLVKIIFKILIKDEKFWKSEIELWWLIVISEGWIEMFVREDKRFVWWK